MSHAFAAKCRWCGRSKVEIHGFLFCTDCDAPLERTVDVPGTTKHITLPREAPCWLPKADT